MPDILIANGNIVDGTGRDPFKGHIAISGKRIESVTPLNTPESDDVLSSGAAAVLDARDLTVAPGFIDSHSHLDWMLPLVDHHQFLYPLVEQGITTVVTGNCGYSPAPVNDESRESVKEAAKFVQERPLSFDWNTMGAFLDKLNSGPGLLFNNVQLVGHGPLHQMAVKDHTRRPDSKQIGHIVRLAHEALDDGAFGLSLGLMYPPGIFSDKNELELLARAVAERDRVLTVHIKALSRYSTAYPNIPFIGKPHNLKALDEILTIGLKTGVKLQISHLIFVGKNSWPTVHKAVRMIEKARDRGLDVMWDIFPHFCGNSYLSVFIPDWFLKDLENNLENPGAVKKLKREIHLAAWLVGFKLSDIQIMDAGYENGQKYNGMNLSEIGELEEMSAIDAVLKIVKESGGMATQMTYSYSGDNENEWVVEKLMAHDLCLFETDTLLKSRGFQNPASYGAFPKFLGHFVRDKKVLPLSEAVAKMSGRVADRFNIEDRGKLTAGNFADVVIFNPDTIADNTSRTQTDRRPTGIENVLINGEIIVDGGIYSNGKISGMALRCSK